MKVTIIGGGGFLGQKLAKALAAKGELNGNAISAMTLADVVAPGQIEAGFPVETQQMDITDRAAVDRAVEGAGVIYHLAAIVSAQAEAEYDLGLEINLMGSLESLVNEEAVRATPQSIVDLAEEARALVASDDLQALPTDLRNVVSDLNALLDEASEAELISDLDVALAAATRAADNIELATQNLPQISQDIAELTARANALELEALVTSATDTLNAIEALIGTEDAVALPASLNGALDEMRVFLSEVREGGAVENVNAALEAANSAARAIEASVQDLPALAARANALVARTEEVIDSYSERSRFGAETMQTLRDIQDAADAVTALSRQIQRNPNSLLTGR